MSAELPLDEESLRFRTGGEAFLSSAELERLARLGGDDSFRGGVDGRLGRLLSLVFELRD